MTRMDVYVAEITDLLSDMQQSSDLHFIRCLLPNLNKEPGNLQSDLLLKQLFCNGVLEGARLSRSGFLIHMPYGDFFNRYHLLHPAVRLSGTDHKEATMAIVKCIADALEAQSKPEVLRPLYQFGLSKIFLRFGVLPWLEQQRKCVLSPIVLSIQAGARGKIARSTAMRKLRQPLAASLVQRNLRALLNPSPWWRLYLASRVRLQLERDELYRKRIADLETDLAALQSELNATRAQVRMLQAQNAVLTKAVDGQQTK
jgi:myosin protein heavy chain